MGPDLPYLLSRFSPPRSFCSPLARERDPMNTGPMSRQKEANGRRDPILPLSAGAMWTIDPAILKDETSSLTTTSRDCSLVDAYR